MSLCHISPLDRLGTKRFLVAFLIWLLFVPSFAFPRDFAELMDSLSHLKPAEQLHEFFGLQLTPRWSPADELQVDVSNWTKFGLEVEKLVVELSLRGVRPCRFNYEQRLELGPTETITPTIADTNAAQECLEMQGVAADNTLRFIDPINCSGAQRTYLFKANAVLQVRGQTMRSQACWVVEAEGP